MYDYVWLCNHTYSISAVIGSAICIFVGPWLKFTPHPLSPLVCFISIMLCPGDRVEISELRECQAKIPKNRIWIGDEYEPWYLWYPWVQLGVSNNTNVAGTCDAEMPEVARSLARWLVPHHLKPKVFRISSCFGPTAWKLCNSWGPASMFPDGPDGPDGLHGTGACDVLFVGNQELYEIFLLLAIKGWLCGTRKSIIPTRGS